MSHVFLTLQEVAQTLFHNDYITLHPGQQRNSGLPHLHQHLVLSVIVSAFALAILTSVYYYLVSLYYFYVFITHLFCGTDD